MRVFTAETALLDRVFVAETCDFAASWRQPGDGLYHCDTQRHWGNHGEDNKRGPNAGVARTAGSEAGRSSGGTRLDRRPRRRTVGRGTGLLPQGVARGL
jgi:hypothetical protein